MHKKYFKKILFFFFAVLFSGSVYSLVCDPKDEINLGQINKVPSGIKYEATELSQWHIKSKNPKFVALVTHGLNLRPSKMLPLTNLLNDLKGDVLLVSLPGHRGSLEEQKNVLWEDFVNSYHAHFCLARRRAEERNLPLVNLSFSLGGLVSLTHSSRLENYPYDKSIFIAPAAWTHWYTRIPAKFPLLKKTWALPSKNLPEYRSQDVTSIAAYRALDKGQQEFQIVAPTFFESPSLFFVDPKDELVNLDKIKMYITKNKLSKYWKTYELSNQETTLNPSYHHLIIDEASMGVGPWMDFSKKISLFLDL